MPTFLRLSLFICLGFLLPLLTLAQPQPQDVKQQAAAIYEEATLYYNTQEYQKALEKFKEAYYLSSEPELLFNIAQCYRLLGRTEDALKTYQNFLRDAPKSSLRANAEERVAELKKQPPKGGRLLLSSDQEAAQVFLDNTPQGPTPIELLDVAAGEHLLRLEKEGFQSVEQKLSLEPGQTYQIQISLSPLPKEPLTVKEEPPAPKAPPRYLVPSLLGGASLTLGAAFLIGSSITERNQSPREARTLGALALSADLVALAAASSALYVFAKRNKPEALEQKPSYLIPSVLAVSSVALGAAFLGGNLLAQKNQNPNEAAMLAAFAISADVTLLSAAASAAYVYLKRSHAKEAAQVSK